MILYECQDHMRILCEWQLSQKEYCMSVRGYSWNILWITGTILWKLCRCQWPELRTFCHIRGQHEYIWVSQVTATVLDHSECIMWVSEVTIILCGCIMPHWRYLVRPHWGFHIGVKVIVMAFYECQMTNEDTIWMSGAKVSILSEWERSELEYYVCWRPDCIYYMNIRN